MEINIRGDKLKVTSSIKNYIEEKIGKLEKYFDNSENIKCNCLVKAKDTNQIIEVTILTSKYTLRAEENNKDLYAATDLVIDKLERQIRKNKTRINKKYKNTINMEYISFEQDKDLLEEENISKIIKRKNLDIKPMDEEEAILQLELIDHDFFIFKNIDEGCVSIIYKRKDSNYGIINAK